MLAEKLMGPVAERLRSIETRSVSEGGPSLSATEPSAEIAGSRFGLESGEPRPQVALIPTGRLSLLPLHATILDEFTVSYAASAMALAVARDTARRRSGGADGWPASAIPCPARSG